MERIARQIIVPAELAGSRLDKAATDLLGEFSRVEIGKWIREGALTVDGENAAPKLKVKGGETLVLSAERTVREVWQAAESMSLDWVYEDEHVLVLNKPAGLVVHPGAGNHSGTLVNGVLDHRPELKNLPRAGIVHRLDKDTSGLMVLAASELALNHLSEQVGSRSMGRVYQAVCEGRMVAGQDIDLPIGRHPTVRTRQAVRDDGKPAFTEVRVLERYRVHTLVQAKLRTGRTHQIRVHLAHIGYPLVGDGRYGARKKLPTGANEQLVSQLRSFPRQVLHARELSFIHPESGEQLSFVAPLPGDLETLCHALAEDAAAAKAMS